MSTVIVKESHHVNVEINEIARYLRIKGWVENEPFVFKKNGVILNIEILGAQMALDSIASFYKCDSYHVFKAIKGAV